MGGAADHTGFRIPDPRPAYVETEAHTRIHARQAKPSQNVYLFTYLPSNITRITRKEDYPRTPRAAELLLILLLQPF